jgi:hypothetical protein
VEVGAPFAQHLAYLGTSKRVSGGTQSCLYWLCISGFEYLWF